MIKTLSISGFRGFGKEQTIDFSLPDGKTEGSGFNVIVGANNSGKSTIIESIRAFNGSRTPSFPEGRRNQRTEGFVNIQIMEDDGRIHTLKTQNSGGAMVEKVSDGSPKYSVIPARRNFSIDFPRNEMDRDHFISIGMELELQRSATLNNFGSRIMGIQTKGRDNFDKTLKEILGSDFEWTVEQRDSGQFYIKHTCGDISHSSEGIGDGILSVFVACSALFDAPDKSVVVIDEPELSLHPALQRRFLKVLLRYSKTHQIIVSTHSPYFVNWEAIAIGNANLIRVHKEDGNSICYQLSDDIKKKFAGLLKDANNPHVLGLEANEIFFLEDKIILVEGQEDVVIYNRIAKQLGKTFEGNFFGWGVGGASKMEMFLDLFKELGYKKVVAILDGDKKEDAEKLQEAFPEYKIETIWADDVRDKPQREIKEKKGIAKTDGTLKDEYKNQANELIDDINFWFKD